MALVVAASRIVAMMIHLQVMAMVLMIIGKIQLHLRQPLQIYLYPLGIQRNTLRYGHIVKTWKNVCVALKKVLQKDVTASTIVLVSASQLE